jgi:hypothetical protein
LSAEAQAPLVSTIPKGAALRGIFVSDRHEVFVDLEPAIRTAHPGGTLRELMTVYTIVNAVLTNLPNLQEVQISHRRAGSRHACRTCGLAPPAQENESLIQHDAP